MLIAIAIAITAIIIAAITFPVWGFVFYQSSMPKKKGDQYKVTFGKGLRTAHSFMGKDFRNYQIKQESENTPIHPEFTTPHKVGGYVFQDNSNIDRDPGLTQMENVRPKWWPF